MNDFILKKAIKKHKAYYTAPNGDVYGINKKGEVVQISPTITVDGKDMKARFDIFFKKDGHVYFSISWNFVVSGDGEETKIETVTKHIKQTDGAISYVDSIPDVPPVAHWIYSDDTITASTKEMEGNTFSTLRRSADNDSGYTEFLGLCDGAIRIDGGYLIHAVRGLSTARPAGFLFWRDGARTMVPMSWEPGRIWL